MPRTTLKTDVPMRYTLVLICFFACLAASSAAVAEHYLISMHGGNGSCGDGIDKQRIHAHTIRLKDALEKAGHKVSVDLTCYERLSYDVNFINEAGVVSKRSRTDYSDWFNGRIAALRPDRIIMVGHSYGGWLSMFLTRRLPPATKIDVLVTVDPISQIFCTITDVLKRFSMYYNQETPKPGCQQAPADMDPDGFRRIAEQSGIWRQYFQARTSPLRSGPIRSADSNHILYNDSAPVASDAHGLIIDHQQIWDRLYADLNLSGKESAAADEKTFSSSDIDAWDAQEKKKFRWAAFSEVSARVRFVFQKAGFSLFPKDAGSRDSAAVYSPNAAPSAGILAQLGRNAVFGYSRSLGDGVFGDQGKVKTESANYFGRYVRRTFYIDANYQRFKGFFVDRVKTGDVSPFRDSVFKSVDTTDNFGSMKMTSVSASGAWLHRPEKISLPAMFTQMEKQYDSNASFIAVTSANRLIIENPGDFIPEDLKGLYGAASGMHRIEVSTVALQPGIAYAVVEGNFYLGGIIAWGPAQRWLNVKGDGAGTFSVTGQGGLISGSAGYFGDTWFGGFSGQKGLYYQEMAAFGFSNNYSSAELFLGRHF